MDFLHTDLSFYIVIPPRIRKVKKWVLKIHFPILSYTYIQILFSHSSFST